MKLNSARLIDAEDTIINGEIVKTEYAAHRSYFINTPLGTAIIDDDCIIILKNEEAFREPPFCIDLFCGAGGASLGMQRAGCRVVGIELDRYAAKTYQRNLDNCIRADVCSLPLRPWLEPDVVWASAPCGDYSTANNMRKKPNSLRAYLVVVAAIQARLLHPKAVIMENVPPAAKSWQWRWAVEIFREGGYDVRTDLLDCCNYGVPQYRLRAIMTASRVGSVPLPPRPTHGTAKEIAKGLSDPTGSGARRASNSFIRVENEWLNWENEQPDETDLDRMVHRLYDRLGIIGRDPWEVGKAPRLEDDYALVSRK